jgi:hypothetical protein
VAGGMESMSNVPFYVENLRWGNKYGNSSMIDGLAKDGLTDCYNNYAMGCAADATALENKVSRGISSKGRMFLDEIVKTKVLIDVKHMSLISRQEFYTTREWHERPILCSHSGVTGCSWYDKLNRNIVLRSVKKGPQFVKIRYKKPKGLLNNTYFNPSSINLYNEDILYVLKSKGLSGYPWILEYWVATGKYMGY